MSLHVTNLHKSYQQSGQKIDVLKGLTLKIATGSVVAIVGQSGSGKSTLLSLLSGLDSSDSGSIAIDGVELGSLSERERTAFRAKKIGIVFQQFHLMSHLTALENVELAKSISHSEQDSVSLLADVGLGHRLKHFPSELSGGENQRVAIARALVIRPSLLLADEPSGNLDEKTGRKVMDILFNQVRKTKTTTVLVTHNQELAQMCDQVFKLENGTL
jgi:putative ABC transport system ATP-binding protein